MKKVRLRNWSEICNFWEMDFFLRIQTPSTNPTVRKITGENELLRADHHWIKDFLGYKRPSKHLFLSVLGFRSRNDECPESRKIYVTHMHLNPFKFREYRFAEVHL